MIDRRLIATGDGSLSMRDGETGELYHNRAGAYTEALENYCRPSCAISLLQERGRLRLIDACFGLGYNSLVLVAEAVRAGRTGSIDITAIERDDQIASMIVEITKDPRLQCVAGLNAAGGAPLRLDGLRINLQLICGDLRAVIPALQDPVDLIFHDPFSPLRVPELWTLDLFRHYFRLLSPASGKLLTYSSAVAVRVGLREAGFQVMRTAAVGDKSGGTVALSADQAIEPTCHLVLSAEEEERLKGRSAIPYRDPQLNGDRADIIRRREAEIGPVRRAPTR